MKVSSREKIFLALLLIIGLSYLAYTYLISPQLIEVDALTLQRNEAVVNVNSLNNAPEQVKQLDLDIQTQYDDISLLAKQYFNTTPQEEVILLFNDLFTVPEITADVINFNDPEVFTVGNLDFLKTSIQVYFTGDYQVLMNILDTVWLFPKKMQVTNLTMSMGETELDGSVTIELVNVMMDSGMVDNLYTWYVDELFDKENPFIPYTNSNGTIRYIYTGEGANLFNFSRYEEFTDLSDHWLETEINTFLKNGYIYMNPYFTFGPDQPMTRGDFVVLLDNVYQWTSDDSEVDLTEFEDYSSLGSLESSYAKAIQKGFLSGFLEGYDDNTLRPANPITYNEVELLMRRIKSDDSFTWATVGEGITQKSGITSENWSNPEATMTKAEAVYLLTYFK